MLNVMLIFYFSVCLVAGFGQILLWLIIAFAARKLKKKNTCPVHLVLGQKYNFEWCKASIYLELCTLYKTGGRLVLPQVPTPYQADGVRLGLPQLITSGYQRGYQCSVTVWIPMFISCWYSHKAAIGSHFTGMVT
jgi:hypothetical protein